MHCLYKEPNRSDKEYRPDSVLNLELPFLENISIQELMSIRADDGEVFASFRKKLDSGFQELRGETDPQRLSSKVQEMLREFNDLQVPKIDQKLKEIKKGVLANTVVAAGSLAGSVITSADSSAATVTALANVSRSYSDYRTKIHKNPAYFLWKAK